MLVKYLQCSNAREPILVTLLGISILIKLLQPENARSPILVTPLPMTTLFKLLQDQNAEESMCFTGKSLYTEGILTFISVPEYPLTI